VTTTYLAHTALDELGRAQAELERHLAVRPDGSCLTCGQVEPCRGRQAAASRFARYGRLPQRRPGLAGIRSAAIETGETFAHRWFDTTVDRTLRADGQRGGATTVHMHRTAGCDGPDREADAATGAAGEVVAGGA
jgi:hypothetical protein